MQPQVLASQTGVATQLPAVPQFMDRMAGHSGLVQQVCIRPGIGRNGTLMAHLCTLAVTERNTWQSFASVDTRITHAVRPCRSVTERCSSLCQLHTQPQAPLGLPTASPAIGTMQLPDPLPLQQPVLQHEQPRQVIINDNSKAPFVARL